MAVIRSTDIVDTRELFTQTPPNFVQDNYYLSELQMKVDADWPYRPNLKWIEEENEYGSEEYSPIEVAINKVKSDVGEVNSDDWYNLIFRDCSRQNRIGQRYRFSYGFGNDEKDLSKNIWIGVNQRTLSSTSSQTIRRCNGTICSIYTDDNGKNSYHYEPVVQSIGLEGTALDYSRIAVDPDGRMEIMAQYNKYTEQYYINQRFVIGTGYVYKVTNIAKMDSRSTFDPNDVGVIKMYLSMDQIGDLDDMVNRIAYNGVKDDPNPEVVDEYDYSLVVVSPVQMPEVIPTNGLEFKVAGKASGVDIPDVSVSCALSLSGPNSQYATISEYCTIENKGNNTFLLKRIKNAITFDVVVTCSATIDGNLISLEFSMPLRPF